MELTMRQSRLVSALLLSISLLCSNGCSHKPDYIIDEAGLLDAGQFERVGEFHRYLLADHDIDYRIVTLNEAVDVNEYANRQFDNLKVGSQSAAGRGLLLVIDTAGNRVRLEVSRALEGPYPDAFIAYLQHRQMTPFFSAGRVADGILAATELIVTRAHEAQANQGWDDESGLQASTAGGGATAPAELKDNQQEAPAALSSEPAEAASEQNETLSADSPETALQAYLQAMADRNADPDLSIYSDASRAMLQKWVVTPAQMDSIVKAYRNCHAEAAKYNDEQSLAVIRYPVSERSCAPWFFERQGDRWQLDLTGAQRYVRFGRDNSWHFDWRVLADHPYRFAFADWGFDNRGFPQAMRWNLTVASDEEGTVWVERTGAGSAAEAFGFLANDTLLRWNGEELHHHRQVMRAMQAAEPDSTVTVDIVRNGQTLTLEGKAPPRT